MKFQGLSAAFLASLVFVAIDARASSLMVTNGDFESPGTASQVQDIPGWFDHTGAWVTWYNPATSIQSDPAHSYTRSAHASTRGDGYIYQSLGFYDWADGDTLDFSFYQGVFNDGNSSAGFEITFWEGNGVFTGADGVDIQGAGLTQFASSFVFSALGNPVSVAAARINTGQLDLTALADGTELWMRIAGTGGSGVYAPIEDVSVALSGLARSSTTSVPEPPNLALLGLGIVALLTRRHVKGTPPPQGGWHGRSVASLRLASGPLSTSSRGDA